MNLYGFFILGVNIKHMVFSILYRHIHVPMAFKELLIKPSLATCINLEVDSALGYTEICLQVYTPESLQLYCMNAYLCSFMCRYFRLIHQEVQIPVHLEMCIHAYAHTLTQAGCYF